jgi:hypothetical protein
MQVSIKILIQLIFFYSFLIHSLRKDNRGASREARCECNDQVEMCG